MPTVSEAQRKAMFAAAEGHSTLGIPKKVGQEFVGKPARDSMRSTLMSFLQWLTQDDDEAQDGAQGNLDKGGEEPAQDDFTESDHPRDEQGRFSEAVSQIQKTIEAHGGKNYGLRVDTPAEGFDPKIGDLISPSRKWADGVKTEKMLTGTSAAPLEDTSEAGIIKALKILGAHPLAKSWGYYPGSTVNLIHTAEKLLKGEDAGEKVFKNAQVVGQWKKKDSKASAVQPNESIQRRAQDSTICAFDKESVREVDLNGHLHVGKTNISKANVCEYFGREIPHAEELGLDPSRKYKLLRHPDELAKGAATFNNLPLLSEHVPVSATDHRPDLVIGSTGTDASFEAPYLANSLVVWPQKFIDKIKSNAQKELSSAYRYRAEMTPGVHEGEAYDGIMRDIVGNHVALVKEGRAGPDVVVGDSKESLMSAKSWYFRGVKAMGAMQAFLAPRLAQDAKVDLAPMFRGVSQANLKAQTPAIVAAILEQSRGHLAQDAKLDGAGLKNLLEAFQSEDPTPDEMSTMPNGGMPSQMTTSMDDDPEGKLREFLGGKLSAEDMATCDALMKGCMAGDEEEDDEEDAAEKETLKSDRGKDDSKPKGMDEPMPFKGMPKPGGKMVKDRQAKDKEVSGMDAAAVEGRIMARLKEVKDAENFVRPIVGSIAIAQDSAEGVYRAACKIKGINVDGVKDPVALRIILDNLPKVSAYAPPKPVMATDASTANYMKQFGLDGNETIRI